jgi:E3 ubiquitin-protein ligase HUWE1
MPPSPLIAYIPPLRSRSRASARLHRQPPDVAKLVKRITDTPDNELAAVLRPIRVWHYIRGDMHAWVGVTKQFIRILKGFRDSYGFGAGSSVQFRLQLNPFTPKDKELIIEILRFIRLLMENCTNRKLFEGYEVSLGRNGVS